MILCSSWDVAGLMAAVKRQKNKCLSIRVIFFHLLPREMSITKYFKVQVLH